MTTLTEEMRTQILEIVSALVQGRYGILASDGRLGRLSEHEVRDAIVRYGRTLTTLPQEAWGLAEVFETKNDPNMVFVDMPLWTLEEGRSDLTLSVLVRRSIGGIRVSINDILVM